VKKVFSKRENKGLVYKKVFDKNIQSTYFMHSQKRQDQAEAISFLSWRLSPSIYSYKIRSQPRDKSILSIQRMKNRSIGALQNIYIYSMYTDPLIKRAPTEVIKV
jgi:hypothetical protein